MKSKKTTFNRYHITVSPPVDTINATALVKLVDLMLKDVSRYCYVIEHGAKGNHPHLHICLEYNKSKRQDTLKASTMTAVTKILPELANKKYVVNVKPAYNPSYLISTYLTKEGELINCGFDLKELEAERRSHRLKIIKHDSNQLLITRASFLLIYEQYYAQLKNKWYDHYDTINKHLSELSQLLYKDNYRVDFLIYNKKQVTDLVRLYHNGIIEFEKVPF